MAAVLLEQDHREQARAEAAARDDVERRRRLAERLAVAAGELLADGLAHEPAPRHDVECLGDDLADLAQPRPAAARAARRRRHHDPLARQVLGQRPAGRLAARMGCDRIAHDGGTGLHLVLGQALLELGQLELELVDEPLGPFAGRAEAFTASLRQQQLQSFDLERGGGDQGFGPVSRLALGDDHRVRRGEVVRKWCGVVRHDKDASTTCPHLEGAAKVQIKVNLDQPAISGRQVRCGIRQSIPSNK